MIITISCIAHDKLAAMAENCVVPSRSYDIVVTGFAGSGKTTLINRLRGSTTEGDHDIQHVGKLKSTACSLGDYNLVMWESPDLVQDSSSHDLEKCPMPSVAILCIHITSTRYSSYHDQVLVNLSRYFKKSVWKICIIALTFADQLQTKPSWKHFDDSKKKEEFMKEVEHWKSFIFKQLISKNVPQKIVEKIPFIPITCNPTSHELIEEQESLTQLKSVCIDKLRACIASEGSTDASGVSVLRGVLAGLCVVCIGTVFPPLIVLTIPCGIFIGSCVRKKDL